MSEERYRQLLAEVRNAEAERELIRTRLIGSIQTRKLLGMLHRKPGAKTSHYWKIYKSFWETFELFIERSAQVLSKLSTESISVLSAEQSQVIIDALDLEERIDFLEDKKVNLMRAQKRDLELLVELLDSANRLLTLKIPQTNGKGIEFFQALIGMQKSVQDIAKNMKETLAGLKMMPITELTVGKYPSPEVTRIIARKDDGTDDHVIVSQIVSQGYRWDGKLFRKADVIVISSKGD